MVEDAASLIKRATRLQAIAKAITDPEIAQAIEKVAAELTEKADALAQLAAKPAGGAKA